MIGWYVHHLGRGHLHRARAVAEHLPNPLTVLSSLPQPRGWQGAWVSLPRDDDGDCAEVTAGGALHWAPRGHVGLRARMAAISAWVEEVRPRAVVSDVSAEVALLARLHGVPVASVVLPGDRSDDTHHLGYRVSSLLVACWPGAAAEMVSGLPADLADRVVNVGSLSRFPVADQRTRRPGPRRVALLLGSGGSSLSHGQVEAARRQTPGWEWDVLGGPGTWTEDPYQTVCDADVVVTHAGENAVAEVAAARRPAVIVPAARPHDEQLATARALSTGRWPAVVERTWPETGWSARLDAAERLDGGRWRQWCDGGAARRLARLVDDLADTGEAAT